MKLTPDSRRNGVRVAVHIETSFPNLSIPRISDVPTPSKEVVEVRRCVDAIIKIDWVTLVIGAATNLGSSETISPFSRPENLEVFAYLGYGGVC
jgi:hypothetical protein